MTIPEDDRQRALARELASAREPAQVASTLANALVGPGVDACLVELDLGTSRATFVAHAAPERARAARAAFEAASRSALFADARRAQRPLHVRGGGDDDAVERARRSLGAEEVVIVTLGAHGALALFGHRIPLQRVRLADGAALTAALVLDRIMAERRVRAEIAGRDTALALLTSLVENAPHPQVFVDRALRGLASNAAFTMLGGVGDVHGVPMSDLGLPAFELIAAATRVVLAGRTAEPIDVTTGAASYLVTVHPVSDGRRVTGAGITLVDVTAAHRQELNARVVGDAMITLGVASDANAALAALATLAARSLRAHVVVLDATGAVVASGGASVLSHERAAALVARDDVRGPGRVLRTNVADAITADELAFIDERVRDLVHILAAPLPGRDAPYVLLAVRERRDAAFALDEIALATDLGRIAARVLDELRAREAVRAWSEMLVDFVGTLARDVRDPLTALFARLFILERGDEAGRARQLEAVRHSAERIRDALQRLQQSVPAPPRIARESFDLGDTLSLAAQAVEPKLAQRGVRLVFAVQPTRPVLGDAVSVGRALRAVVEHVAKLATVDAIVCVRAEEQHGEVIASVSHSSGGYSLDEARVVFDSLWEGRTAESALTAARATFTVQGGRAWVESTEGSGAAYCFALPCAALP